MPNRGFNATLVLLLAVAIYPLRGAVATNGQLIAFQSNRDGDWEIFVMDPNGEQQRQLTRNEAEDSNPRWSPDSQQIAFVSNRDGNPEIYIMNADGSDQIRLTDHPDEDYGPTWSPDGSMIAYNTRRFEDGGSEIVRQNVDETWGWNLTRMTDSPTADDFISWSPDGRWIAFESDRDRDDPEIYLMNAVDGTNLQRLTFTRALDEVPSWSPDSQQILFSSDLVGEPQNGNYEIFIMNADGSDLRQLTEDPAQDTYPSMSPDGKRIVFESYRDGHAEIYRMNADGSNVVRLTQFTGPVQEHEDAPSGNGNPAWSPHKESATSSEEALGVVDAAIEAHGGLEKLKAAATWVAQIRRYQRGDSYAIKSYYRPGMVRLAQDLGDGSESADVIGDPHCWGMRDPVSIPCSPETRENDRPRVIMEMAVQLWPLKGEEWVLTGAERQTTDGIQFDTVTARYLPRNTAAEFKFDPDTHLLHSISVQGVKEGVYGTHLHTFSEYREYCGVLMPSRNEKSFEGDVWVAEDVLELECRPVEESLFLRPQQVAEGAFSASHADSTWLACTPDSTTVSSLPEQQERLNAALSATETRVSGPPHSQLLDDGTARSCAPVDLDEAGEHEGLVIELLPASDVLSIFSLQDYDGSSSLVDRLRAEVQRQHLTSTGPVRMVRYDNDGMGLTGELVIELQLPVE